MPEISTLYSDLLMVVPATENIIKALNDQQPLASPMVKEHIDWDLKQLQQRQKQLIQLTPVPLRTHLAKKLKHLTWVFIKLKHDTNLVISLEV
jgi:hypothetical protein